MRKKLPEVIVGIGGLIVEEKQPSRSVDLEALKVFQRYVYTWLSLLVIMTVVSILFLCMYVGISP